MPFEELHKFLTEFAEAIKDILQNTKKWCDICGLIDIEFFYKLSKNEAPAIWLNPKLHDQNLGTFKFDLNIEPKIYKKCGEVEYKNVKFCKCLQKMKEGNAHELNQI